MKISAGTQSIFGLLILLLTGCAGSSPQPAAEPIDRQWSSGMQTGLDAYSQGQYQLAERLFNQALQRARQMDHAAQSADAAFNLAASRIQLGDFGGADSALRQAKSDTRRTADDLSEILLLEAQLARWQGADAQSARLTDELLRQLPQDEGRLRPQALLLKGQLACEAGQTRLADQQLQAATELCSKAPHPTLVASLAELRGCIAQLRANYRQAAAAYDLQTSALREARQYRQLVSALQNAGDAYQRAGNPQLAADRLYRAARSAFSQERLQLAQQLLDAAQSSARSADSATLQDDLVRLQSEITAAAPAQEN